jgi:hypothetical protein
VRAAVSIHGHNIVYHRPEGGERSAPPRCTVASEPSVSERIINDESKFVSEGKQEAVAKGS